MYRKLLGLIASIFVIGIVVAWVRAQDESGWRAAGTANSEQAPAELAQHLRSATQAINQELTEPAGTLPGGGFVQLTAAGADEGAGRLRSVLKRSRVANSGADNEKAAASPSDASPRVATRPSGFPEPKAKPILSTANDRTSSRRTYDPSADANDERTSVATRPEPPQTIAPQQPAASEVQRRPLTELATPPAAISAAKDEVLVSSVGPLLRVDTTGPKAITVGHEAIYVVTLSNRGDADAGDVMVRVAIPESIEIVSARAAVGNPQIQQGPDGVRRLIWNVSSLPGRADSQLAVKVVPRDNRHFDLAVDWAVLPITASARIEVQQPQLRIALSGPRELLYGESQVYTVILTNPGTGDANNVAIEMSLGDRGTETLEVGTVPAGGKRKFDVEITARETGTLQIFASATGTGGLQAQINEQLRVRRAMLELAAAGPPVQFAGAVGAYQVRLTNTGDAAAHSVQAAVRLPQGVKYLKGLDGAKQIGDALAWNAGDLAPGSQRTYQFFCHLTTAGENRLTFGARSNGGVEAAAEVLTRVEVLADLKLMVNDPKGPLPVGQVVDYEIKVTNRGSKASGEVQIVAVFAEGVEAVAIEGWRAEMLPGRVVFHPIARIVPGETVALNIKAKADREGNHAFRAEVNCSDPQTRMSAEDTTTFYGAATFSDSTASEPSLFAPAAESEGFTEADADSYASPFTQ